MDGSPTFQFSPHGNSRLLRLGTGPLFPFAIFATVLALLSGPASANPIYTPTTPPVLSSNSVEETATYFEVFQLLDRLTGEVESLREKLGDEAFKQRVATNDVKIVDANMGSAEVNTIDGHLIARVVHKPTRLAFLIMDVGEVAAESSHLDQYVARQHIDANDRKGRDVNLVWVKDGAVESTDYRARHPYHDQFKRWLSVDYLKEWKEATYKTPTWDYFKLAVLSTGFQVGLAAMAAGLKVALNPSASFDLNAAILCVPYGMGIGTFYQSYRNWVVRGTKHIQKLKSMMISLSFAYTLKAMTAGSLESLFEPTLPNLFLHLGVWANVWVSNKAKVEWDQIVIARREMRVNAKNLVIRGHDTGMNQGAVEGQALYAIGPFMFRLLDLTNVSFFGFPIGKVLFFASTPLAAYLSLKNAEKLDRDSRARGGKGYEHLGRVQANWEFFKKHPVRFTFDIPKLRCQRLLTDP